MSAPDLTPGTYPGRDGEVVVTSDGVPVLHGCTNAAWAAANGETYQWARGMWFCDCVRCSGPAAVTW